MRIPIPLRCKNGHSYVATIDLSQTSIEASCPTCGDETTAYLSSGLTVGFRILQRSKSEINESQEYSVSIIFSAMAFECELSRLFGKWKNLAQAPGETLWTPEQLEEMLREFGSIKSRIEKVTQTIHPGGMVEFLRSSENLAKHIQENFSTEDVSVETIGTDIEKKLFWPRNRVLHHAIPHGKQDAVKCWRLAALGLFILAEMDSKRASGSIRSSSPG